VPAPLASASLCPGQGRSPAPGERGPPA
jgi:hypothetical protein